MGIVKNVLSATSIIVSGAGKEKRLVLSGITAPRLGFGPQSVDEPFAFQAKEFTRALLLGKKVSFVLVNGAAENEGSSEQAEVTLDGVNVAHAVVSAGWAKTSIPPYLTRGNATTAADNAVPDAVTKKDKKAGAAVAAPAPAAAPSFDASQLPADRAAIYKLQLAAEKNKVGMFKPNPVATVRKINRAPVHLSWLKAHKGKPVHAIVDRVMDGSMLRLEIPDPANPASLQHTMLTVNLAGARCARMPMSSDKNAVAPEGAAEAVAFVEQRLLNRDVELVLLGLDKAGQATNSQGALYGSINHPKGNIAVRLLETNLAKYVPWTAALLPEDERAQLQAAANVTASSTPSGGKPFEATVVQIVSGDVLVIKTADGKEQRVCLASVSAPRSSRDKSEPFAFEAKEFLRKSLIMKPVTVIPEYTREGKAASPEEKGEMRQYVTVFKGKYNVATELVAAGLADVTPYSKEADRPASYVELCAAEAAAIAGEKGKHSKKAHPAQVHDFTRVNERRRGGAAAAAADESKSSKNDAAQTNKANADRLKIVLDKLIAQQNVHGVVEAVFAPNLLKVFVPMLHAYIPVTFAAIQGPRSARRAADEAEEAEEGAKEKSAAKYKGYSDSAMAILKQYMQQDITLEVSALSRQDSFLANVLVTAPGAAAGTPKDNLAVTLVKQGLAALIPPVAERNAYKKQLQQAESEAKKRHLNIWVDYDEEKERAEYEKARTEAAQAVLGAGTFVKDDVQYLHCVVTDVVDPVHFYINSSDDKNVELVKEKMAAFSGSEAAPAEWKPIRNDIVAALFDEDNSWYRARIDNVNTKSELYSIQFIDFGNVTAVPLSALRPLPKDLAAIKPLARPCKLSCLKPPIAGSEYFEAAANAFADITAGVKFAARIDGAEPAPSQLLYLTLYPAEVVAEGKMKDAASANTELIRAGWLRVNPRPPRRLDALIPELERVEAEARASHVNIWEYGYYASDMDD